MGMKEKFMESMMGGMSAEDKRALMKEMMEKFFSGMSAEEKREMMRDMMPLMMGQMAGGGADFMGSMMGMMGRRHGRHSGTEKDKSGKAEQPEAPDAEAFSPFEMCKRMMAGMGHGREAAAAPSAELNTLFEEWSRQMDEEILGILGTGVTDPDQLASQLKIGKDSLLYFLVRLARQGRISLKPEPIKK